MNYLGNEMVSTRNTVKYTMNRSIFTFFGDSAVLGCGKLFTNFINTIEDKADHFFYRHPLKNHKLHNNPLYFYTFDSDPNAKPDCILDVAQKCPWEFKQRFDFVLIEYLPSIFYMQSGIFSNNFLNEAMSPYSVIVLLGEIPRCEGFSYIEEQEEKNEIETRKIGKGLYIKSGEVSPILILESLNLCCLEMIKQYGFDVDKLNQTKKNDDADKIFIKDKTLKLIYREISRLDYMNRKEDGVPLNELNNLYRQLSCAQVGDLKDIVNVSLEKLQTNSNFRKSITYEILCRIMRMEIAYFTLTPSTPEYSKTITFK